MRCSAQTGSGSKVRVRFRAHSFYDGGGRKGIISYNKIPLEGAESFYNAGMVRLDGMQTFWLGTHFTEINFY